MNKNILDGLITFNQEFEKKLEDFPFKLDAVKLKDFEEWNYFNELVERFIPEMFILGEDPEIYKVYIKDKYRTAFLKAYTDFLKNEEIKVQKEGQEIEKNFMDILLKYNTNPKQQDEEVQRFLNETIGFYEMVSERYPKMCLIFIAEIRSPRIQYVLLNKSKIKKNLSEYVSKLNRYEFEMMLKEQFMYPLEVELEIYYKKWIGKNKIHVKFCKNILGDKYEYAKKVVKLQARGKPLPDEEADSLFAN